MRYLLVLSTLLISFAAHSQFNCPREYPVTVDGPHPVCSGLAVTVRLLGSEAGVDYTLVHNGVEVGPTIEAQSSGGLTWQVYVAGSYTVRARKPTCTRMMSGSAIVSFYALPNTTFTVSSPGVICDGSAGAPVNISGSQAGINYQLLLNGAFTGDVAAGTGGALVFPNRTAPGFYTVRAVNPSNNCSAMLPGGTNLVSQPVTMFPVSGGGTMCQGASGLSIILGGSQTGVNYELRRNGTLLSPVLSGTGGTLAWNHLTEPGTYDVRAVHSSTGCNRMMSGTAGITVHPLPSLATVGGGGPYCSGGAGVPVTLSTQQTGVSYQLKINGLNSGAPKNGVTGGGMLTWPGQTTAGTYTIQATYASTGCMQSMTGSATVSINALPSQYVVQNGGTICSGSSANVTLNGSQTGVNYQLKLNGSNLGSPVSGTNSALSWPALTSAGSYTVTATNASTGCVREMEGNASIIVNPLPELCAVTGGGTACAQAPGLPVKISCAQSGINYQLKINGVNSGASLPGTTGTELTWSNQTTPGTYTVEATNVTTGCGRVMDGSVTITIVDAAPPLISGPTSKDTEPVYLTTPSVVGFAYQWKRDGEALQGETSPSLVVKKTGEYTVTVSHAQGCEAVSSPHFVTAKIKPLHNGVIRSIRWRTDKAKDVTVNDLRGMQVYHYDDKYQVREAQWAIPDFSLNTFSYSGNMFRLSDMDYDPNGNIQSLRRYNDVAARVHDFSYRYNDDLERPQQTNQLRSIPGYAAYRYDDLGRLIEEDKVTGNDQYIEYDVTGKVRKVYASKNPTTGDLEDLKVEFIYDDSGFRLAKKNAEADKTTWYIRDASGSVMSVFETATGSEDTVQTEIPIYGAGKLGTYYPQQDGSAAYEITDHLGNVRALVRDNITAYTATMEDSGQPVADNPRVKEMQDFVNLFQSEHTDVHMNHSQPEAPVTAPDRSAYLFWQSGVSGIEASDKSVGPGIMLEVKAGDKVEAEAWVRYEKKVSYSRNIDLLLLSQFLGTSFAGTGGFENYTPSQTASTFESALTGANFMSDGANEERPFAYINYILFNENMALADAGWHRIPEDAGFTSGQEALSGMHRRVAFDEAVEVEQSGYIYVWVSNESENTRVWFDDLKVTHSENFVTQATDYGVWGDVIREQKADESTYRFGYQGQFAEKDGETGWNHFDLREYDPLTGRFTTVDPAGQFSSPYVGMGNNPGIATDPTGGLSPIYDTQGRYLGTDSEGFRGQVLIFDDPSQFVQGMDHSEALKVGINFDDANLSGLAQSRIYTHILDGIPLEEGMFFNKEDLYNGMVSIQRYKDRQLITYNDPSPCGAWCTSIGYEKSGVKKMKITASMYDYETTVENVRAVGGMHEYWGHGKKGFGNPNNNHHKAYEATINSRYWNGTSDQFKQSTKDALRRYYISEKVPQSQWIIK